MDIGNITNLLLAPFTGYCKAQGIKSVNYSKVLDNIRNIPGYEFYAAYKGTTQIGFIGCMKQNGYMFGDIIYLDKKYRFYLKALIEANDRLVKSLGLKGVITSPDVVTRDINEKHNIAIRIDKWTR